MDYGLLGGLAEGLKQGLLTYKEVKEKDREAKIAEERAKRDDQLFKLGLLDKGAQVDASGNIGLTPEELERRATEGALKSRDAKLKEVKTIAELADSGLAPEFDPKGGLIGAKPNGLISPRKQKEQIDLQRAKLDLEKTRKEASEGPKPTADQSKVAGFAKRVEQAEAVLDKLESKGYNRADVGSAAESKLPGILKGSNLKQQEQAETNFINAVLRRESGAAISDSERSSAESQYFPRAQDPPEVLEQKRQNRLLVIQSLKGEAGERALGNIDKVQMPGLVNKQKADPSSQDNEAVQWAKANPKDPRSAAILKANGL